MAVQNPVSAARAMDSCSDPIHANPAEPLTDEERERIREVLPLPQFYRISGRLPLRRSGKLAEPRHEVQLHCLIMACSVKEAGHGRIQS